MKNHGSGTNKVDWVREARETFLIEKKKSFIFDNCYQIIKEHKKFDLSTTSLNTQHSRYGPSYGPYVFH
ncbi:hypothetical protein LguiA_016812 [Lonicera macranthoides]